MRETQFFEVYKTIIHAGRPAHDANVKGFSGEKQTRTCTGRNNYYHGGWRQSGIGKVDFKKKMNSIKATFFRNQCADVCNVGTLLKSVE